MSGPLPRCNTGLVKIHFGRGRAGFTVPPSRKGNLMERYEDLEGTLGPIEGIVN
jgi:hypothetical protein